MAKKNTPPPPPKRQPPKKRRKLAYNSKQLTLHLRELAAEAETITDDGVVVTKGEALAKLLWKKALGYTEMTGEKGERKEVIVKPASWAIQLIYERMEGKAPLAIPEDKSRQTAARKVNELARSRINSLSDAIVAVPSPESPVDGPDHGDQGPEGPD